MILVDGAIEQLAIGWNQAGGLLRFLCADHKKTHINHIVESIKRILIDVMNNRNTKWQLEIRGGLEDDSDQSLFKSDIRLSIYK